MKINPVLLALSLAVALPFSASAHDMAKGPHGGQVADDAGHHVEFTTNNGQVVLFLSDNADKPITTAKATGRVIIQDAGTQAAVDLVAAEPNILSAKLAAPIAPGAKLAVSIKLGDGHDVKARFVAK